MRKTWIQSFRNKEQYNLYCHDCFRRRGGSHEYGVDVVPSRCLWNRVVTGKDSKSIEHLSFYGWGSHCNTMESTYLTAASGMGMEEEEVKMFIKRLDKVLEKAKIDKGSKEEVKDEVNGAKDGDI